MHYRCLCICRDTDEDMFIAGVMSDDLIEAAVACDSCRNNHVRALLVSRGSLGLPPKKERPRAAKGPDPRSWEEIYAAYQREQRQQRLEENNDGC